MSLKPPRIFRSIKILLIVDNNMMRRQHRRAEFYLAFGKFKEYNYIKTGCFNKYKLKKAKTLINSKF